MTIGLCGQLNKYPSYDNNRIKGVSISINNFYDFIIPFLKVEIVPKFWLDNIFFKRKHTQ